MCPACIATARAILAGATSAGGLIALFVRTLPATAGTKRLDQSSRSGGEQDG